MSFRSLVNTRKVYVQITVFYNASRIAYNLQFLILEGILIPGYNFSVIPEGFTYQLTIFSNA